MTRTTRPFAYVTLAIALALLALVGLTVTTPVLADCGNWNSGGCKKAAPPSTQPLTTSGDVTEGILIEDLLTLLRLFGLRG